MNIEQLARKKSIESNIAINDMIEMLGSIKTTKLVDLAIKEFNPENQNTVMEIILTGDWYAVEDCMYKCEREIISIMKKEYPNHFVSDFEEIYEKTFELISGLTAPVRKLTWDRDKLIGAVYQSDIYILYINGHFKIK